MPGSPGYKQVSIPAELYKRCEELTKDNSLGLRSPSEVTLTAIRSFLTWYHSTWIPEQVALQAAGHTPTTPEGMAAYQEALAAAQQTAANPFQGSPEHCAAITAKGTQCTNRAADGTDKCRLHS